MKFNELDVVKTNRAFPEHGIIKGELGTVVMVFSNPTEAYEVEFADNYGRTRAMFAIPPEELDKC